MVLAIVSRSFGVGIKLTNKELVNLNEGRKSEKWGHDVETKATIEINGSTKKKEIKDRSTLVQFF